MGSLGKREWEFDECALDGLVGHIRLPPLNLVRLDLSLLVHLRTVDDLVRLHRFHDRDQRRHHHRHDRWYDEHRYQHGLRYPSRAGDGCEQQWEREQHDQWLRGYGYELQVCGFGGRCAWCGCRCSPSVRGHFQSWAGE